MSDLKGSVNNISHHPVIKPGSTTTPLLMVSNSSLNNNNSGQSLVFVTKISRVEESRLEEITFFPNNLLKLKGIVVVLLKATVTKNRTKNTENLTVED